VINELLFSRLITKGLEIDENSSLDQKPWRAIAFLPVCLFVGVSVNAADLSFEVIAEGDGETAQNGMQVSVHYQGRLTDGTIFDDSQKRGTPFSFTLGSGQVIPGWEQGIAGMKIGEKRVLTIPPELGYGAAGAGGVIPPNATLVFDVELVAVAIPPKLGDATAADLQAAQKNGVVVIDIRRVEEWAETGIIEGAHTITAFTQSGQLHPNFRQNLPPSCQRQIHLSCCIAAPETEPALSAMHLSASLVTVMSPI
jgi:hypothetical protein